MELLEIEFLQRTSMKRWVNANLKQANEEYKKPDKKIKYYGRRKGFIVAKLQYNGINDYVLINPETDLIIGVVSTWPTAGQRAQQVQVSAIDPAFTGKGLAMILYDTILVKDHKILRSGSQQTSAGSAMWKKLIKNPNYTVWVQNPSGTIRGHVEVENDEISSDLPLYSETHRFNMYAIKRRR